MPISPPISAWDCTDSVGTGPFTLLGIRQANRSLPSEALSDGATVSGVISLGKFWIDATFAYASASHTLTVSSVQDSSSAGAAVVFPVGRKLVTIQATSVPATPTWSTLSGNPLLHAPITVAGTRSAGDGTTQNLIAALITLGIPLVDGTTAPS